MPAAVPTGPSWRVGGDVVDKRRSGPCVAFVAGRDSGAGDHLAAGVSRDVSRDIPLVPIEASCRGLVAVAGLGAHDRDDTVFRDLAGDAEGAVLGLLQVLAEHARQQLRRFSYFGHQPTALQ